MKKLLLGAAFAAMGCTVALAQDGPKAFANSPAAVQASSSVIPSDLSAAKKKKKKMKSSGSLKGNAVGPETGTAKDKASAPAR